MKRRVVAVCLFMFMLVSIALVGLFQDALADNEMYVGLGGAVVHSLAWDGNSVFAGCVDGHVYRYGGGTSWTDIGAVGGSCVNSFAWNGTNLYAGSAGGVYIVQGSTFYFAEGTCRPGFDPYITIQNPGSSSADVTLTYMKGDGTTASDQITVAAKSRATAQPRDKLGTGDDAAHDFSTKVTCSNGQVVAERPMYFNYKGVWTGGHDVVGFVPVP